MQGAHALVPLKAAHNRRVPVPRNNLVLVKDYGVYLRVEKGLRPLTCEAYQSDLRIFAEFLEGRNGTLLTWSEGYRRFPRTSARP